MKTLQVIESAYRATIEEQDDTVVWLTHAIRAAGGKLDVLLVGSAVSYAVCGQATPELVIGTWRQSRPPNVHEDLTALAAGGARVYAIAEDLEERGVRREQCFPAVIVVPRPSLADLYEHYPRIWQW